MFLFMLFSVPSWPYFSTKATPFMWNWKFNLIGKFSLDWVEMLCSCFMLYRRSHTQCKSDFFRVFKEDNLHFCCHRKTSWHWFGCQFVEHCVRATALIHVHEYICGLNACSFPSHSLGNCFLSQRELMPGFNRTMCFDVWRTVFLCNSISL